VTELIGSRYELLAEPDPSGPTRAVDLEHSRPVALHLRPAGAAREEREVLRLRARELVAVGPHPGLALIRDGFIDGDRYVLVADWVEGPTLADVLAERGRLPRSEALEVLAGVAEALEHLHGCDPPVAHGGIRPEAIVLAPDRGAVPVAFALPGDAIAGPPPEDDAGPAGDVYALAAMAVELLAGAMTGGRAGEWEDLGRLQARAVERVLAGALASDPLGRPSSARRFVEDLRTRLEGRLPTGTVTLLLTDVEGSTWLWEQHPAAMRHAVARHDDILADAIVRHGGQMPKDQGEGDSTLSAFPAAADAVASALDAQRALQAEHWPQEASIRVRVALHTGHVQVTERNYRGSEVNRCARLRSIAHGGQILLTSATAGLVRGRLPADVRLKDLGLHRLKDVPEPEQVFTLFHPDLPADFPPLRSAGPVEAAPEAGLFVGRDREMGLLLGALDQALAGRARLSLLVGDAGIGKSRTCLEAAAEARRRAAAVFWGRCFEQEGAPSYWPWVQVIRSYVAEHSPEELRAEMGPGAADMARVVPEIADAFPGLPPPPEVEPDSARFRLFDSMAGFFRAASRERPLLLVLDDLHWADRPSLLLLEFLARELGKARVLILAAYREPARGDPLALSLGDLIRQPITERIVLGGLTERQAARYIELASGVEPPAGLTETVHRLSEGNPFYLREIILLLQEQGRLGAPGGAWEVAVPQSVREVIGRRLGSLSRESRETLGAASVAGRDFRADVVAEATAVAPEAVLDRLDQAVDAGIVIEDRGRPGGYTFTHALIRETLYDDLPSGTRARLHLSVGRALESRHGPDPGTHAADLAHHFLRAAPVGGQPEALRYLVRAGDVAMSQLAYEDGTRHYGTALSVTEAGTPIEEAERCDLLLAYGTALWHSGEVPAAKRSFQDAAGIARSLRDGPRLAQAALGYGDLWIEVGVVDEVAVALLEEAMAAMPGSDDPLRAQLLARLAMELSSSPEAADRRAALSAEAVHVARRGDGGPSLPYTLLARRHAMWGPDHLDERYAVADEAVRLAERAGDLRLSLRGRSLRLIDLLEQGEVETASREIEAFAGLAEDLRSPVYISVIAVLRAALATMAGRFDEAEGLVQEVFRWGERISRISTTQAAWAQLLALRRERGGLGDYVGLMDSLVQEYAEVPAWRAGLALVHVDLGNLDEARRQFEILAERGFDSLPRDGAWMAAVAALAEVCDGIGDRHRAEDLYRLLLPFGARNVVVGFTTPVNIYGAAARYLGVLASTMERWEEADWHFRNGEAMNERMGATPWLARTRYGHALMLQARGRPEDLARADTLLGQTLEAARRLGMDVLLERGETTRRR
jgi:class 3 adenylate cyclase/tetratricopeptide (TPR) repeat protein